jgi:hypothetical protein
VVRLRALLDMLVIARSSVAIMAEQWGASERTVRLLMLGPYRAPKAGRYAAGHRLVARSVGSAVPTRMADVCR